MAEAINNQVFFSEQTKAKWKNPPIVVAWKFSFSENLGALLRVCDNFGVQQVYFIGEEKDYKLSKIKRLATTSFSKIELCFVSENDIWNTLPQNCFKIAVDTTSESVSLNNYRFDAVLKKNNQFCLFFGNESIGLQTEDINQCDDSVHIPMIGSTYSMNVVQAASVVLFESVRQCLYIKKID